MKDLQNLLETVLWTGYLDDEDAVSLFIISKPEGIFTPKYSISYIGLLSMR